MIQKNRNKKINNLLLQSKANNMKNLILLALFIIFFFSCNSNKNSTDNPLTKISPTEVPLHADTLLHIGGNNVCVHIYTDSTTNTRFITKTIEMHNTKNGEKIFEYVLLKQNETSYKIAAVYMSGIDLVIYEALDNTNKAKECNPFFRSIIKPHFLFANGEAHTQLSYVYPFTHYNQGLIFLEGYGKPNRCGDLHPEDSIYECDKLVHGQDALQLAYTIKGKLNKTDLKYMQINKYFIQYPTPIFSKVFFGEESKQVF
jgi:hypothetical protein